MSDRDDRVQVWHVRLQRRSLDETKGWLSLGETSLRFTDEAGTEELVIAYSDVRGVRRHRGSPLIQVAHVEEGRTVRTAFYFTKPPPLHPPATSSISKRRIRRASATYLQQQNYDRKPEIVEWYRRIREAVERSEA